MARTPGENNVLRAEIAGSALAHTNDPMTLQNGESMSVTYSLGDANPTVTISATLKLQKNYDPVTDALETSPWFEEVTP